MHIVLGCKQVIFFKCGADPLDKIPERVYILVSRTLSSCSSQNVLREKVTVIYSLIIFALQTAELLQVYSGQMDMIFSVHVNSGRVSV